MPRAASGDVVSILSVVKKAEARETYNNLYQAPC